MRIARLAVAVLVLKLVIAAPPEVTGKIDWSKFLERQDPVWETLPQDFDTGAFLGNGLLGTTIFRDGENRLRFEMGRADVTEHRRDNDRLPIGGIVLTTAGKIQGGSLRLDLWNAEVRGEVSTTAGALSFRAFIPSDRMALLVDLQASAGESHAAFQWEPRLAQDARNATRFQDPPNPPNRQETVAGVSVCVQPRFAGGEFAAAWKEIRVKQTRRVIVSIADSFPGAFAHIEAATTVNQTAAAAFAPILTAHRNWWHTFYPKSFVSIPDAKVESFYWIQLYKLACASRPDHPPVDLLGPWYRTTGWPRIWWNLNIQTLYLPVYTANHLELGESLTRFLDAKRANFARNAKEIWGFDDAATVPHTTDNQGLRGDGSCAPDKFINPGDFTWALQNYYLQYRYSMDASIVTGQRQHAFYPLLRASVNLYLHLLKPGADGKLHLPKMHSPEYGEDEDNNYNLSLLRWACQTLIDLNRRYSLSDPLLPRWQETLANLVDYQVDESGLRIGASLSLTKSHRHWSHMLMVHPLHILDTGQPANRELIAKSIDHWLTVDGAKGVYGWSRAAAASLYATLGDGENAIDQIHRHLADARFVRPNTMYIEGSPVIECSIVLDRSVQDLLLQSWGGTIRVFPAVPGAWRDAVFQNLRAEGAFLVSAARSGGTTQWIRVESLAGEPCRVKHGLVGVVHASGRRKHTVTDSGPGTVEIDLRRGEAVVLYSGDRVPDLAVAPVESTGPRNSWGVKSAK